MLVEMNPSGGGGGTEITPSNSSPVVLTSGETYTTNGNGYAIQSYTSKTPSSSPSSVSSGDIVKMGGSGYLINSYSSVTPSTSGTYFSAGMKNMASSGYAYSSKPSANMKTGTFTGIGSNTEYTIQCGFAPKTVYIYNISGSKGVIWNSELLSSKYIWTYSGSNTGLMAVGTNNAYPGSIESIGQDSVTFRTGTNSASNPSTLVWNYVITG